MRCFLLIVICCFLSCNAPPPAKPMLEVSISKTMYCMATCRLKNDQLAWYAHEAPKDIIIHARKISTAQYVTSQSDAASACVYLDRYAPQDPDAPLKEISFFHTLHSIKGMEYKTLVPLPDKCVFWLQKADGYYLITNVEKE